ncbi:DUF2842 domain-containing protein [Sphingomonas sp. CFBP 13720]|jgi:hypothetical protein|uniref:DUF2842 domain-containing protein n=1 Tax=Sphingomonas sp. CFBP 13720 TaxID=2775302 RepID=UPI001785C796|nr:DUF2842 domain-containing protein [Sphingomonas sp. CFBP 13720]MBD8679000.1 DUF2842 domain-containing protein [Sphingomonas sp. CFBP 13720]
MNEPSWRKPAGVLAILAMLSAWAVLVATLSGTVGGWHWLAQLAFYLIAGIAWLWVLPMRPMLRWMETGRWRRMP